MKTEEQLRDERVAAARTRMAELSMKFVERTKNELQTLRKALDAGNAASIVEIRYLAHRMAGTGATLGFDTLSDHAMRVEEICDQQPSGAAPDAGAHHEIAIEVDAIEAELRKLDRTRGA